MSPPDGEAALLRVYGLLEAAYRGEPWYWPPDRVQGPIDVVVGAVLVQHTTWTNAERALERLRAAGALDPGVILELPEGELAALIRVSGTPAVKERRLSAVAATIVRKGGTAAFLALPLPALRAALLATHGVGPETADAIALYAAGHAAFVIDAYTRRIFRRLGLGPVSDSYDAWQRYFEDALAQRANAALYQRYHAFIVLHGRDICRTKPRCAACPLLAVCPTGAATVAA